MVFQNPALYFRTFATRIEIIPDPSDLPADQILEFPTKSENIVELVKNSYQNNVSIDPAVNPDGTKKVNLQDNGRLEDIVQVTGKLDAQDTVFIDKFKQFARKLQIEPSFHVFGIFGFAYPVSPTFDLDPDADVGFFIDSIEIMTKGESKKTAAFSLNLKTGGTLV
jgi:hypothetical protein